MNKLKEILVKVLYPGGILSMLIVLCGFGVLIYFFITQQNNSLLAYAAYSLSTYAWRVACSQCSGRSTTVQRDAWRLNVGKQSTKRMLKRLLNE